MANKWQRRRWSGLGKRCEVTAYVPSEHLVEVAADRTKGMVDYFIEVTRPPADYRTMLDCIEKLARSCYLQGAHDTAEAAARLLIAKERSG